MELLKHPFLKKAKDRRYLAQTLIALGPSLETRAQKARNYRKGPGASGRLHRTETGDWVWSSDSEADDDADDSEDGSDGVEEANGDGNGNSANETHLLPAVDASHLTGSSTSSSASGSSDHQQQHQQQQQSSASAPAGDVAPATIGTHMDSAAVASEPQPINLVLRMRLVLFFWNFFVKTQMIPNLCVCVCVDSEQPGIPGGS